MSELENKIAFIVDDEEIDLFITQRILKIKKLAAEISVFRNGNSFLKAIESGAQPDYILLNYRMPDKNGLQIVDELVTRFSKSESRPFIIITSSTAFTEDIELIKSYSGVDAFLPKPILPEKLKLLLDKELKSV
jgi:CheY-like chemotaxis protein